MIIETGDALYCVDMANRPWSGIVTEITRGVFAQFTVTWNNTHNDEIKEVLYSPEDLLAYLDKGVIWLGHNTITSKLPEELFTI